MPCSPACSDPDATIIARNTNSYVVNDGGQLEDLTCTGGYQAYCCTGFVPSSVTNSGNLNLYGQTTTTVSKRDGSKNGLVLYAGSRAVEKRGAGLAALIAGELGALCVADAIPSALGAVLTFGLSLIGEGVSIRCCGPCRPCYCGHHRVVDSFQHRWVAFRWISI